MVDWGMEKVENINAERIRWCCDDRGISLDELCAEVKIAESTMAGVMAGEKGLTFKQLQVVAAYFNRGVLFFLAPGPVQEQVVRSPQFRTLSNQKPELTGKVKEIIERTERQRERYLGLLEELNESPEPFIPANVKWAHPGAAADWMRERLGLTEKNTFATYREAVEALGVLVFRSNGYAGAWQIPKQSTVAGFSLYHEVCPVVFVRKQPFEARQTFTLFHELGHLLLHRDSFIDDDGDLLSHARKEVEANAFAGLVLVPDFLLARIPLANKPPQAAAFDEWLEDYRKAWGVSAEVILRRLADSGKIPQRDYEAYRRYNAGRGMPVKPRESGSREWRYREPVHLFGTMFVKTVFDALNTQHIPLTRATRYLDGLKVKDLHQLEAHYAHV